MRNPPVLAAIPRCSWGCTTPILDACPPCLQHSLKQSCFSPNLRPRTCCSAQLKALVELEDSKISEDLRLSPPYQLATVSDQVGRCRNAARAVVAPSKVPPADYATKSHPSGPAGQSKIDLTCSDICSRQYWLAHDDGRQSINSVVDCLPLSDLSRPSWRPYNQP